jgi:hypothetical protein
MKSGRTLITKILENFTTFLRKLWPVEIGQYYELHFFLRFELTSSFFFKVQLNHAYAYANHAICRSYMFLTKEKVLPNIYGVRIVGGSCTHPRSQF